MCIVVEKNQNMIFYRTSDDYRTTALLCETYNILRDDRYTVITCTAVGTYGNIMRRHYRIRFGRAVAVTLAGAGGRPRRCVGGHARARARRARTAASRPTGRAGTAARRPDGGVPRGNVPDTAQSDLR